MYTEDIYDELFKYRDEQYRSFQSKLLPGIYIESIIGVKVGILRRIAKDMTRNGDSKVFMNSLPHTYYEENILHSLMINEIKDFDNCIYALECFMPFVDNWAVCDTLSPKIDLLLKYQPDSVVLITVDPSCAEKLSESVKYLFNKEFKNVAITP
nr:DNA alkylation repair protein [Clostridia bacterium]